MTSLIRRDEIDAVLLDMIALHRELTHLIGYPPFAEAFLGRMRTTGRRTVLVTNAHRGSLDINDEVTSLTARVDDVAAVIELDGRDESR